MARREQFTMTSLERRRRQFSPEFKRQKIDEYDRQLVTIRELCKEYEVSKTSVYKWIYMYSKKFKKGEKMLIESESDTRKLAELKEKVRELERIIGQKQLLIDFQSKVIELAEEEYKVDIKKKLGKKLSSGIGSTENTNE